MKKSYNFISKDFNKLLEMLSLRRAGWTFVALADLYNCDRTSLRYQCRKYQVFPDKKIYIKNSKEVFDPRRISHYIIVELYPKKVSNWKVIDGEKINTGKSYADYLASLSPYKKR